MLARIRNFFRTPDLRNLPLLVLAVAGLASCAAKEKPSAISNASTRESSLPWNQQEKWENEGNLGPLSERFDQGGNRR